MILTKEGKILLLKRLHDPLKDYWVLPGGYLEYDEDPKTAIIREVEEETGLTVKLGSFIYTYLIDNDPRGNSVDIVFDGTIVGGKMKLREHDAFAYFDADHLPEKIAYKHREVIELWYQTHN